MLLVSSGQVFFASSALYLRLADVTAASIGYVARAHAASMPSFRCRETRVVGNGMWSLQTATANSQYVQLPSVLPLVVKGVYGHIDLFSVTVRFRPAVVAAGFSFIARRRPSRFSVSQVEVDLL